MFGWKDRTVQRLAVAALVGLMLLGCNRGNNADEAKTPREAAQEQVLKGNQEAQAGNHEAAQQAYEEALKVDPNSFEAYHAMGKSLAAQGKVQEAEAAFRKALELKPDYLSPRLALADLLAKQGKTAEAVALLEEVAGSRPSPSVLLPLARYYEQLGQKEKAIATYEKVLEVSPGNAAAQSRLQALKGS